ncbi:MAG: hypothetical protein FWC89_05925 [Defluviitaleaceae bacterium]|nr:hypothetical protein [Defluviitaleaceae bacterium]
MRGGFGTVVLGQGIIVVSYFSAKTVPYSPYEDSANLQGCCEADMALFYRKKYQLKTVLCLREFLSQDKEKKRRVLAGRKVFRGAGLRQKYRKHKTVFN